MEIDKQDEQLVEAATAVLRKNYTDERHTVGAAVRCGSLQIYAGVNIESCGYGPCAEPIALGAAICAG
jgi:cytidine deaminase